MAQTNQYPKLILEEVPGEDGASKIVLRKIQRRKFEAVITGTHAITGTDEVSDEGSSASSAFNHLVRKLRKLGEALYNEHFKTRMEAFETRLRETGAYNLGRRKSGFKIVYSGPESEPPYTFVIRRTPKGFEVDYRAGKSGSAVFSGRHADLGKAVDQIIAKLSTPVNQNQWALVHQPKIEKLLAELIQKGWVNE